MSYHHLWEHFVVVGLAPEKLLQTVLGDSGFVGTDQKYKPDFLDCLPHCHDSAHHAKPPPQLPTCCLPAGVDIVLHQDLATASLVPHTYAVILTEGDGTKVYASCLSFYDKIPHALCTKYEALLGAVAFKAICLLSHQPYLASTDKVLRELYNITFVYGSTVPLPDVISSLLSVPLPQLGGPQVCLSLGRCQCIIHPPLAAGPPPGELSLQPLLEVLQPDNLVGLFAAVLLEQRVLLRSRHHWLLTAAAEGVLRLLHPLKYQHVYIPVMPISLTDYLDAPTPFLMGLHSSVYVEPRCQQHLVVVDLDADTLSPCKSDMLLQRCLSHPYMLQLRNRIRMLMQPCCTDVDTVGEQQDPWVMAAQQLGLQPWAPCKQALLIRMFLEFYRSLLDNYQTFLVAGSTGGSRSSMYRALSGVQGLLSMQIRVSGTAPSTSAGLPAVPPVRSSALSSMLSPLQPLSRVDMAAVQEHHALNCGCSDPTLLQHFMQGLPFLSFAEENNSTLDSQDWFTIAEKALYDWRAAEQQLQAAAHNGARLGTGTEVIQIPRRRASPLMPPCGLVYPSFPALIVADCGQGLGLKLRRSAHNSRRRQSAGRRRAISELMGSQVDLRRKSPVQTTLKTEAAPERQLRVNGDDSLISPRGSGISISATLQTPGTSNLGYMTTSSTTGCAAANGHGLELSEYSAEADVVRRQTGLLVQLMHLPCSDSAAGREAMKQSDLEAIRLLLCMQTDGNGWFLVSRLKEIISAGITASAVNISMTAGSSSGVDSGADASNNDSTKPDQQGPSVSFSGASQNSSSRQPGAPCSLATSCAPAELLVNIRQQTSRTAASAPAGGGSSSISTASQKPPSSSKSSKLFGVSKSNGSFHSASPPGLKVSHSMESFANAAQAMASFSASVLNRSISTKGKSSRPSSPDLSPPHNGEPASERATTEDISGQTSMLSRPSHSVIGGPIGNIHEKSGSKEIAVSEQQEQFLSHSAAAVECSIQSTVAGCLPALSNSSATDSNANGASSSSCSKLSALSERHVCPEAFDVLSDMMNSIIEVAAVQDDFRVVLAALELSCVIACQSGTGANRYLLSSLATNPILYEEWFWAGAFAFAVTSGYLQANELVSIRDVVLLTLAQFARYITGLGISGTAAWLLLAQLSTEHFGTLGAAPLHADDMMHLRAHLAHLDNIARHERSGVPYPVQPAKLHSISLSTPADKSAAAVARQLPEHVKAALRVCGLSIGPEDTNKCNSCKRDASKAAGAVETTSTHAADATAAHVTAAGGGWRLSQTLGSNKLAAMEWDAECALSQAAAVDRSTTRSISCSYAAVASTAKQKRLATSCDSSQALGSAGNVAAAAASNEYTRVLASPGAQQQQVPMVATTPTNRIHATAAGRVSISPPTQVYSATLSSSTVTAAAAAKLSCSIPASPAAAAAAAGAEQSTPDCSSDRSTPRSGHSPGSPGSPKSPRGASGYMPQSPRGLSRLSAGDARQQYGIKAGSSSRSYMRRNSYASGRKAAATAVASALDSPVASKAAAADACITVEQHGKSLLEQGALQHAVLHSKPVVAMDASSHTLVSIGLDARLKVVRTSDGYMRLAATMCIPALGSNANSSSSSWHPGYAAMPVVKLWRDGHRVAVGNAKEQAVWVLDLQGSAARVELPGLGGPVSAIGMLERNQNALLTGLSTPGHSCNSQSNASALYLWDLRQAKKPAASLDTVKAAGDFAGRQPYQATEGQAVSHQAGVASTSTVTASATNAAAAGILSLTVHDDGALAAAGCSDGKAVVWDMRHPSKPLATCIGHQGPVTQAQFLPADAVTASSAPSIAGMELAKSATQLEPALQLSKPVPLLLTGGEDWTARLWNATDGSCKATCVGHAGPVTAVQVTTRGPSGRTKSDGGTRLVTAAADGSVAVWDLQGELHALVQQHWAPVQLLALSDNTVVSGAEDRTFRVWSLPDVITCSAYQPPEVIRSLECHASVCSMAYDRVAGLFSAGHRDGTVSVWNCTAGSNSSLAVQK